MSDAYAVMLGVVCGVLASVPISVLVLSVGLRHELRRLAVEEMRRENVPLVLPDQPEFRLTSGAGRR